MGATYHLLAQQLGKLIACVEWGNRTGTIVLCPDPGPGPPIEFAFDPWRIASLAQPGESVGEVAVRIAVAQARKRRLFADGVRFTSPVQINEGMAPWIGDLTTKPYGGATFGIEQRDQPRHCMSWAEPERRIDAARSAAVENALRLLKKRQTDEAKGLLAKHEVPEHVVLRVTSCAAFRRKPG
jgi:hypothetical protein